jgi:hypothetical protein
MFDIDNCVKFVVLMAAALIFRAEAGTWLFLAKRPAYLTNNKASLPRRK